jgi:hypothetical protein
MNLVRSVQRARVVALVVMLAVAGVLLTPAPSQAVVLAATQIQAGIGVAKDVGCTLTGPGSVVSPTTTFAPDGVPVQVASSTANTIVKTGDPSDTTTANGSMTSTTTATQAAGALSTVDISTRLQTTVRAAKGSAQTCNATLQSQAIVSAAFDLPSPKYLLLDVDTVGLFGSFGVVAQNFSSGGVPAGTLVLDLFLHFSAEKRIYLPAGSYIVQAQLVGIHQAPTPAAPSPEEKAGDFTAHLAFVEPGLASSAGTGTGAKYVGLAAGRSCAAGSLTATWTPKAGKGKHAKIKKATFRVNGAKVRSVKKPTKKQVTTLAGLDPNAVVDVTVSLKPAARHGDPLTVERTYLPCT